MNNKLIKILGAFYAFSVLAGMAYAAQKEVSVVADTYLRSDQSNNTSGANGGGTFMFVGQTASTGTNDFRALLSFDLSGVSLPTGATINSVSLVIQKDDNDVNSGDAILTLNLHRLMESFDEAKANWATRENQSVAWAAPGGTFDAAVLASQNVGTKGGTFVDYSWSSASLTEWVGSALSSGSIVNLLLKNADETGTARELIRFVSREGVKEGRHAAQLVIDYTVNSVPEPSTYAVICAFAGLAVAGAARRQRKR
ncbi:DNRLRE domain-containing protein [Geminisphaera colitermitum]|uniref:DNRLRE domain-containing protein n=1 Tax=Geminisphaera colitermitum TaxID=1148786 RepID=UPI000158D013|nr:DNRLRE domain-containing protein [Geminisphaera colitermitum]